MSSSSNRRKRKSTSKSKQVVPGAGNTYPGLPYFSIDKELEAQLDKSPAALKRLPKAAKTRLAIKLRLGGATYEQIADKLGYKDATSAMRTMRQVINASYELDEKEIGELVKLDLLRLDAMQLVMWEKATRYGDVAAVDRVLKIMETRRELLGMSPRAQQGMMNLNVSLNGESPRMLVVGGTETEFINQLRQMRGEEPIEEAEVIEQAELESGDQDKEAS